MFGLFNGWRKPPRASHALDTPLIRFPSGDFITLGSVCEGVFISGGPGSGKTSGPGKELVSALFELELRSELGFKPTISRKTGALILCAKPDEGKRIAKLAEVVGRAADVIHVTPTSGHRFDVLNDELTRPGGSVESATRRLELLLEQEQRASGGGHEAFWQQYASRIIRNAVAMVYAGTGQCSVRDCYRFMVSAPSTPAQGAGKDAEWKQGSFAAECMRGAAHRNIGDVMTGMAFDFWAQEWPNTGEKTRSSGFTMVANVLAKLLSGPVANLISGEKPNLFPRQVCDGKIIILDVPVLTYHDPARLLATAWKTAVQYEVLRREVHDDTPPVLCLQDEFQFFMVPDHDMKVSTVSRQCRLVNICIGQNVPMFMAALGGGPKAEQEFNGWLADMQCWISCQNGCPATNDLFSKRCGTHREILFSGRSSTEPYDPVSDFLGLPSGKADVSFSEQWQPVLKPHELARLAKGGRGGIVESFLFMGGRKFRNGDTHLRVAFKQ